MAVSVGTSTDYQVQYYVYDPRNSDGQTFEAWAAQVDTGSFILHIGTGTLYIKMVNNGEIIYYPFTGINDTDIIDANFDNAEYPTTNGVQLSDDRKKDYKADIDIPLASILKIPLKYFTYKDNLVPHVGTSAQSLQKICPELVVTNKDGYLMVDYAKLSLLALRAVKLQQAKIKTLESRLSKLEERFKKIENNVE